MNWLKVLTFFFCFFVFQSALSDRSDSGHGQSDRFEGGKVFIAIT